MNWIKTHIVKCSAVLAFLAAFVFFQVAYPYHLMRREQMNLFLFDWDYIRETYRGVGWLARFVCDFVDQFFLLPVVGPLVVALLLTAIGVVVYRICRHFLGKWSSLGTAALFYVWSFLRETDNLFSTRYTLVLLAYLSLVLLALQARKAWMQGVAAAVLLAFGAWALGSPFHRYYGRPWGKPVITYDRVIGLDSEVSKEHWDKVIRLSKKDLHLLESSYCYNLAHAMKGDLARAFFNHSQESVRGLLLRVSTDKSAFSNCMAGEAWFQLGDMTLAEQSAIIMLQASPKHTGTRYLIRLARANLISGEDGAAQKYLDLLSKTLFYGNWAKRMMPGNQDAATVAELAESRERLARTDFVHHSVEPRNILLGLLEADPENALAREYLLVYDLLTFNLDDFAEEYALKKEDAPIFHEALLIWLSLQNEMTEANAARYGIAPAMISKMERFFINPDRYRNTYWYFYLNAMLEDEEQ